MTTPPVFAFPNNDDPFILDTDASDTAVGDAWYQIQNEVEFSRWLEVYDLPEQTTVITAKTFFEQSIARFGAPLQIHSDQGRNFDSLLFTDLFGLMEITKTGATPYRSSSNKHVRRYTQKVLSFIRCYLNKKVNTWDEHLSAIGMSIRATVNSSTGFTSNMLFLGINTHR